MSIEVRGSRPCFHSAERKNDRDQRTAPFAILGCSIYPQSTERLLHLDLEAEQPAQRFRSS